MRWKRSLWVSSLVAVFVSTFGGFSLVLASQTKDADLLLLELNSAKFVISTSCEDRTDTDCVADTCNQEDGGKEGCEEDSKSEIFCDDLDKECVLKSVEDTDMNPAAGLKLLEAACKANPQSCEKQ